MCELFGFSSHTPKDIRDDLKLFFSHSVQHPHGWGMMREQNAVRECFKEPVRAIDSTLLPDILQETQPQKTLLAHIRFATVGRIRYENCHPFTSTDPNGREWTMIHNGTIYSGKLLIQSIREQTGDTDSERLFLYLMYLLRQEKPYSTEQRFRLIERFVTETAPRNKLNLLIYDGELLYVHKNMQDTLFHCQTATSCMFSTTPLHQEGWEPFPLAQLCAYHEGQRVFTGTPHPGIFHSPLTSLTPLDAMNI